MAWSYLSHSIERRVHWISLDKRRTNSRCLHLSAGLNGKSSLHLFNFAWLVVLIKHQSWILARWICFSLDSNHGHEALLFERVHFRFCSDDLRRALEYGQAASSSQREKTCFSPRTLDRLFVLQPHKVNDVKIWNTSSFSAFYSDRTWMLEYTRRSELLSSFEDQERKTSTHWVGDEEFDESNRVSSRSNRRKRHRR
jgi:hypothetical protein